MKISAAIFPFLMLVTACAKETPLTAQERVATMLTSASAWQDPIVTVDGVDRTNLYKDFSITFFKTSYTTLSGDPVWNASGAWVFLNEDGTLLKLDGVREVEINSISDDALELSFLWDLNTYGPGRVSSIKGKHRFRLKKKKK